MPEFVYESVIEAPVETVFGFHERPDALPLLSPRFPPVRLLSREGGIEAGARVVMELRVGPIRQKWVALHTDYEKNRLFVDVQVEGPFASWTHRHEFQAEGARTRLTDRIRFSLKGGPVADLLLGWTAKMSLQRTFEFRHRVTRRYCEG